jgi:hypothetical protein
MIRKKNPWRINLTRDFLKLQESKKTNHLDTQIPSIFSAASFKLY